MDTGIFLYDSGQKGQIKEPAEKGFPHLMEEQIIQEFVHRISTDENLRKELVSEPDSVIMREGFSPRVARVIARLVPHLKAEPSIDTSFNWWFG